MVSEGVPVQADDADRKPIVLVVEDEILIRIDIAEYLRENGFTVVEAANAAEAVEVFASSAKVDIVFSDVHMPGEMDGFELARWIGEHFDGVPVLLTSGAETSRGALPTAFIAKPYIFWNVEKRLRQLLDERQG